MPPPLYPGVNGGTSQTLSANTADLTQVKRETHLGKEPTIGPFTVFLAVPNDGKRWRVATFKQVITTARPTACHLFGIAELMRRHAKMRRRKKKRQKNGGGKQRIEEDTEAKKRKRRKSNELPQEFITEERYKWTFKSVNEQSIKPLISQHKCRKILNTDKKLCALRHVSTKTL